MKLLGEDVYYLGKKIFVKTPGFGRKPFGQAGAHPYSWLLWPAVGEMSKNPVPIGNEVSLHALTLVTSTFHTSPIDYPTTRKRHDSKNRIHGQPETPGWAAA